MSAERILITGSHGMLGSDLLPECQRVFGKDNVIGLSHSELDIVSFQSVNRAIHDLKATVVMNAAAYTDVDGAETDQKTAHEINVIGPENLAKACTLLNAKLIHFSTDQVFGQVLGQSGDGVSQRPWTETDEPHPGNYYAKTKWEGEQSVRSNGNHVIVRVQWLYGAKKERFTQLKTRDVFTPFADQWGAPTWTLDVARVIPKLIRASGLFHFAYDDFTNWAQVFDFVKSELHLSVKLEPKRTQDVKLPATRPLYCVLSNEKLKRQLGVMSLGSWKDSLREFLGGLN